MLAKTLAFAVVLVGVLSEEQTYTLKTHVEHKQPKEYKHYQQIPLKLQQEEPKEIQYQAEPESQGHTYSSQSVLHQEQENQESHEGYGQAAPVYE